MMFCSFLWAIKVFCNEILVHRTQFTQYESNECIVSIYLCTEEEFNESILCELLKFIINNMKQNEQ